MPEAYGFPKDFKTGDELIALLHNASRARSAASQLGSEWPGERGEPVMLDRVACTRLGIMFEYLEAYYPETVKPTNKFGGQSVELADISARSASGIAYSPKFTPVFKFEQQKFADSDGRNMVSYAVRRERYDPDLSMRSSSLMFNKVFDSETGQATDGYDNEEIIELLKVLERPMLYFKDHLEESRLAWKIRQYKARRAGKTAIKYAKLPNG